MRQLQLRQLGSNNQQPMPFQQQQQPNNPFLSPPPPSMLNVNNNAGLSSLPLQMQQLNNERLLRNQLLLSSLNQQLLQQQSGSRNGQGNSDINNQQQQQINSLLSRPSASDLASTSNPKTLSMFQQPDNGMLKFANNKMNGRELLDTSSPFFPSLNNGGASGRSGFVSTSSLEQNDGSSGLSRGNSAGFGGRSSQLDQLSNSNEGFVDEVADGLDEDCQASSRILLSWRLTRTMAQRGAFLISTTNTKLKFQ
uniref:Uncharacterized protein n=1 Tax=Ditylenchus dipsaci TaxID=166011 RepID=A0A915DCN6_9BILA